MILPWERQKQVQTEEISQCQRHPVCPRRHQGGWGPGARGLCTEFCPFTEQLPSAPRAW